MTLNGNKPIAIIGGGISGLATLHYLKKRFASNVDITLYEKKQTAGGNIQTHTQDGFLCEYGPNAFLNNKPTTLEFINELGLSKELISSNSTAKKRFIIYQDQLMALPMDPLSILMFKPFTLRDRTHIFTEIFRSRADNRNESIANFVKRRLGSGFVEYVIDPFVSGVFAGDVNKLHMNSCFPQMCALEDEYGSLIKAMIARQKKPSRIITLKDGMESVIKALVLRYRDSIKLNQSMDLKQLHDQRIIFTVPSYSAATLIKPVDHLLADALEKIVYAPVIVIGLGFKSMDGVKVPQGFGYLNPSSAKRNVLGVLFESHVFESRAPQGGVMLRVMIGGRRNPGILDLNENELIKLALDEIKNFLKIERKPDIIWVKRWPLAIPQYELDYPQQIRIIQQLMVCHPNWYLTGNYINGISFNDCIAHAAKFSENF